MPCRNSTCKSCCPTELPCGCPPSPCCKPCCKPCCEPKECDSCKPKGTLYKLPPKTEIECEPIKVTVLCSCECKTDSCVRR